MSAPTRPDPRTVRAWLDDATPARLFTGRSGSSYPTTTLLSLRADHAAARDAVLAPLDLTDHRTAALAAQFAFLTVTTTAEHRPQYLRRPDLGRRLPPAARELLIREGTADADIQLVIGDGLSATAVHTQLPDLLPPLVEGLAAKGWTMGRPIVVEQCRVGVLNDIGELLNPTVVILLIGERPGLATAESLSAYLAHRPRHGHTDADRNLISNIHRAGIPAPQAAHRIVALADAITTAGRSGVEVKEPSTPAPALPPADSGSDRTSRGS